jgi:universal stress protein E
MPAITKILIAVRDPQHAPRRALRKGAALARALGARIELFHAVADPIVTDAIRHRHHARDPQVAMESIRQARERKLRRLTRPLRAAGIRCDAHCSWDFPAHEAIVRRALQSRASLVIVESERHPPGANWIMSHADWELVRTCPVPLLLAKTPRAYQRPDIVVAIDPFHAHEKPARLDRLLLAQATDLAHALKGRVHAAHAYLPMAYFVPSAPGEPSAVWIDPELETSHRKAIETAVARIANAAGVSARHQHVLLGAATDELAALTRRLHAQLLVMGAVSRSGLKRLFLGNTAQRALNRIACDILVVKPRGFRTPVPRSSRATSSILGYTVY